VESRSAEGRLLLASLAWAGGRGPELAAVAAEVTRWPRLLARAGRTGIGETLAYALAASGTVDLVPQQLRERVRAAQELGAARNLALLSETSRLQALLAQRGIPSVALKGTALVAAHYPVPGARHVSDLDLLVPVGRISDAAAALSHEGPTSGPKLDHHGRAAHARSHLAPFDTAGGVSCELHHQVPGYRGPEMAERVLAGAQEVAVGRGCVRITAPIDSAAVACVHAFAGHRGAAAFLPRLVADLEALDATGGVEWAAVLRRAGPEGAGPVERGRALLERARAGDVDAVFASSLAVLARELVAPFVRGALADPGAGVRAVFPSRRFMATRYGVPERSMRLFLYYLARPFIAVRGRLRR
jgi:hypothetical protein